MDLNDTPEQAAYREKARTWLEAFYVGMSRGRESNMAHVVTGKTAPEGKEPYQQASAEAVMTAIGNRMAYRTVILITHRPPPRTDRFARILALDHGRLSDLEHLGAAPGRPAGLAAMP